MPDLTSPYNDHIGEDETLSKPHHPHDSYFKRAMSYHQTALVFFKTFLPAGILAQIDISTLKPAPTEFIDKMYGKTFQDVLYTVQLYGKDSYLYLHPAHQSSPDPWMAWRMLKSVVDIADYHRRFYNTNSLPTVIPLLYYHGVQSPYPYSLNPFHRFEDPEQAYESIVNPLSTIVDASRIEDGKLEQDPWCGSMVLANKHLRDLEPLEMIEPLTRLLKPLENSPDGHRFLIETLEYYLRACAFGKPSDSARAMVIIEAILSENTSGEIMSIMDHVEEKGKQEGINQRNYEIAVNLLKAGISIDVIADSTGLRLDEVQKLKTQAGC